MLGTTAVVCIVVRADPLAAAPPAAPQKPPPAKSAPAPKPLSAAARAVVEAAVDTLRKEHAAYLKSPKSPLRTEPDYFAKNKSSELTPEMVLAALEQPLAGDVRTVAYVRWQFLSALPETLDSPLLSQAIGIYRSAPRPLPRYGLAASEQATLDVAMQSARKQDDVLLNTQLDKAVKLIAEHNGPVIAYR